MKYLTTSKVVKDIEEEIAKKPTTTLKCLVANNDNRKVGKVARDS